MKLISINQALIIRLAVFSVLKGASIDLTLLAAVLASLEGYSRFLANRYEMLKAEKDAESSAAMQKVEDKLAAYESKLSSMENKLSGLGLSRRVQ